MKIGIMYDSNEPEAQILFDLVRQKAAAVTENIEVLDVAAGRSAPCTCCFLCWTKTPGACVLKRDAGTGFAEKFWNADYVVMLSRITWGGYSARVKMYLDRIIPILHPYFRKVNGEMHHKLRYDSFPVFLAVGYGAKSESEEETFLGYTASIRDQGGSIRPNGTFVVNRDAAVESAAEECGAWLAGEVAI